VKTLPRSLASTCGVDDYRIALIADVARLIDETFDPRLVIDPIRGLAAQAEPEL
jgi:hypothetical protein